jgi:hypothetical protein
MPHLRQFPQTRAVPYLTKQEETTMSDRSEPHSRRAFIRASATFGAGIVVGGIALSRVPFNAPAIAATTGDPDPTATREAELKELHDLQTQVAQPVVCTPAPTPTPTEVPIMQMGVPVPYQGGWTITVLGITPSPAVTATPPTGKYMQANLLASHSDASAKLLYLTDFVLRDSQDRFSVADQDINTEVFGGLWLPSVEPGQTANAAIVFDVAADAGDAFVLESKSDPGFRVAVTVEQRG